MALYRTEGIVLRVRDLGDADRILEILTRQGGRVDAVAHGARRPRARLAGVSQTFTHARFLLWSGRELATVSQAEIVHSYPLLYEDLDRFAVASYLAELAEEVSRPGASQGGLFELLSAGLALVAGIDRPLVDAAARFYELNLLQVLGMAPRFDRCVGCGSLAVAGFSAAMGGVLCDGCLGRDPQAVALSPATAALARHLLARGAAGLAGLTPALRSLDELGGILAGFFAYQLGFVPKTPRVVRQLRS